jgi:hypothetical protein
MQEINITKGYSLGEFRNEHAVASQQRRQKKILPNFSYVSLSFILF